MPKMPLSPPRLRNLDDLFGLNDAADSSNESIALNGNLPHNTEFQNVPFDLMDDFPDHPFRLYDGERESDMVESIRANGILQPIILRLMENGRYQILSGHNRKYTGIKAGLIESLAVIKRGLSDAEAMMYIVETNLMQRSFTDMTHSEKATVIALHHSKLFSQGKRNDIFEELRMLENPHECRANGTFPQVGERFHSDKIVGEMYSLSKMTVARYLRIHHLIRALRARLDNGEFAFTTAVTISFLKESEQKLLDTCIELNNFTVDMKKAEILRQHSEAGKLDDEKIYLILSGEAIPTNKLKPNRTPTVKVSKAIYARYFKSNQSAKEVQDIVEKALALYFEHTA